MVTDMVLPTFFLIFKTVNDQGYPKGTCPRNMLFPSVFFLREALLEEWLYLIMQRNNAN